MTGTPKTQVATTPRTKKLRTVGRQNKQSIENQQLSLSPAIIMKRIEIKQPLTPVIQRKPSQKFFKTPQGDRTYSRPIVKKSEDYLKWFEEDGLYGFHCED